MSGPGPKRPPNEQKRVVAEKPKPKPFRPAPQSGGGGSTKPPR